MISSTVIRGFKEEYGSWNTICISLRSDLIFLSVTFSPLKITSPPVGLYNWSKERPTVVLPQPDSPTSPSVSPGLIAKDTPSTAFNGIVFPNPVLIGKYCFKSFTSTKYSFLSLLLIADTSVFGLILGFYIHPAACKMCFAYAKFFRYCVQADLHCFVTAGTERTALWHI